jgi:hypothetical protein
MEQGARPPLLLSTGPLLTTFQYSRQMATQGTQGEWVIFEWSDHEPFVKLCEFRAELNGHTGGFVAVLNMNRFTLGWSDDSDDGFVRPYQGPGSSVMDDWDLVKELPRAIHKCPDSDSDSDSDSDVWIKMRASVVALMDALLVEHARSLNLTDAIAFLKEQMYGKYLRPEAHALANAGALLDQLLCSESTRRLRCKKATVIQKRWRSIVANPYHPVGRSRLMHEFCELRIP